MYPGNAEVCDTFDNDCNSLVDDGATDAVTWYADFDGDGYGGVNATETACTAPTGYLATADDCDDLDATSYPSATEVCDSADNDCDTMVDNAAVDAPPW